MKKVLKIAGAVLGGLVVLLVLVGLIRGPNWQVERSMTIQAPPEVLLPLVADFEKGWTRWSVWHGMDPQGKWEYGGTAGQVGHWMKWNGPEVGNGKLTLTKADSTGILYDGAIESEEVNDKGVISFSPDGTGTKVTWRDDGKAPPIIGGLGKGYLQDFLGAQFEKNLAKLKTEAESDAKSAQN